MANEIALVTANQVTIVESIMQTTAPAGEAITPGAPVRFDANGAFVNGNATDATENNLYGIATGKKAIPAGWPVTAIRIGVLDGFALTAMAYGDPVYVSDTDARLSTVTGTTKAIVGMVIPATANVLGAARDKLMSINVLSSVAFVDTTV
jgi:hypothetical protein